MADKTPEQVAEDFRKHLKSSPFVMIGLTGSGQHSEPMTAFIDDDRPDSLYFFTSKDNRIAPGGKAMAQFSAKGHDFFACLAGNLAHDHDRAMVEKLWSRHLDAWFPGGKDDPNLVLLRFDVDNAELWEADMSLGGMVKMLFGGRIKPDEEGSHAVVNDLA